MTNDQLIREKEELRIAKDKELEAAKRQVLINSCKEAANDLFYKR